MSSFGGPRPKRPRNDSYNQSRGPGLSGAMGYMGMQNRGSMQGYGDSSQMGAEMVSRILHINIKNPTYPITVDVLHTICSPSGNVLRIAINKTPNAVQALVEFSDVESARSAMKSLHGADIYSGCCTLDIMFSKKQGPLNIAKNDTETWDYTDSNLGTEPPAKKTLLASPSVGGLEGGAGRYEQSHQRGFDEGYGDQFSSDGYEHRPPMRGRGQGFRGRGGPRGRGMDTHRDDFGPAMGPGRGGRGDHQGGPRGMPRGRGSLRGGRGRGASAPHQHQEYYEDDFGYEDHRSQEESPVLMLYGLNFERMNCQKIFNLFCLYGNVKGVKFLKSKEGVAMVEMGDSLSAGRARQNLTGTFIYGKRLIVDTSTSTWLQEVLKPFEMKDGSPSYMDFARNRMNRFRDPNSASSNRIQPPFKTLYFFNVPPGATEEQVAKIFEDAGATPPMKIKLFRAREKSSSATGLIEWENVSAAIEAMILAQHATVPNPGGQYPFTFKLCFSSSPIIEKEGMQ